ncbi:tyrosine-type recombinase/integrase [Massilia sp. CCM 8695]|uniref:Tyrosine-type recombinase/integrase n=1 Tax=Massilia frigida TaxID=2609281 RepID=A0ABX0N964_9BURK|nr:tyrosine-type recombinase/integrase [Massilia frigida]NHZ81858.1 tyrosine-type recombinase/integrase [Massilia frigida]
MGRKNTRNLNMPPHMHPRKQRSGKVYFYMYTQDKPRKEIALGDDFILALKKYAELNVVVAPSAGATFGDVQKRYLTDALPKLAASSAKMYRSDIKHLMASFGEAPLSKIKPMHIRQFLDGHADKPTTANRCKRVFSTMWNKARGWGYTDLPNPCEGIQGHSLAKRTVYITDAVFKAVHDHASAPLRDAMDLAYLTGQRPADALSMSEHDIIDGHLIVTQEKTKQPLRIQIVGELAALLARIEVRKAGCKMKTAALLVNRQGKRLTAPTLRAHFDTARAAAGKEVPELKDEIEKFWFYDLRAKAADDTSDDRGDQAASDLLGHDSVKTTQRHYLRRGKIVAPTK